MESLLTAVADYLARQSWQVAVVFVLVAAACYGLQKASAHWRYLLWLIVLAKCVTPGLVSVPLAVWPHPAELQSAPAALPLPAVTPRPNEMQLPTAAVPDERKMARATAPPVSAATEIAPHEIAPHEIAPREVVTAPKDTATNAKSARSISLRAWLVAAWCAGVALFIGYVSVKAWSTHRKLRQTRRAADPQIAAQLATLARRLGMNRTPAVYMVDAIAQPFVWGWFRGSIYVPRHFLTTGTAEHQQAIMAHELAHVARWDAAVNLVQIAVQALFFFHPLVWWTNRQIRRERENCCDETVIAGLGVDPRQYGQAIVDTLVAEYEASQPAPSLAVTGSLKDVEQRIETILSPDREFFRRPSWAAVTAAVLLAVFVVPTALVLTVRGASAAATPSTPSETEKKPPAEQAAKKVAASSSDQPEPGGKSAVDKDQKDVEGITVDSEGKPLADVQVVSHIGFLTRTAVSGPDGRFRLVFPNGLFETPGLLAEGQDHSLIGFSERKTTAAMVYADAGPQPGKNEVVRVVLKPARTVRVKVATSDGKPAVGVMVQALGETFAFPYSQTDRDGQAAIRVPPGASVQWVIAWKDDLGFDYYENYHDDFRSRPVVPPVPLPATVELSLHKAGRFRVRTIDSADRPVAGVTVVPTALRIAGKLSYVGFLSSAVAAGQSDAGGNCDFAWLPADAIMPISFQVFTPGYYGWPDEPHWDPAQPQTVTVRLVKFAEVSGTVRLPDGKPAAGITIRGTFRRANGYANVSARTDADGRYRMGVFPRQSMVIAVSNRDWVAASHTGVRLDEGGVRDHLDFALARGTRIHGRITPGRDKVLSLFELGEGPEEDAGKSDHLEGYRQLLAQVDDMGNYEFRVGPGRYSLRMPVPGKSGSMADGGRIEIKVAGQPELVYDDTAAWPDKMRLSGRVVSAADGKPVAGAIVYGKLMGRLDAVPRDIPLDVHLDAQGRFSIVRLPDTEKYGFYARVPESDLAGVAIVSSSASEVKVEVSPAATVVGSVYDAGGKPVAGEQVIAILSISSVGLSSATVNVVTDKSGRYRVPCLAVDSACWVQITRQRSAVFGIRVPLDRPGEISARDIVLPADGPAPSPEAGQLHAVPLPLPAASGARKERPASLVKSTVTRTLTGVVAAPDGSALADVPIRWWDLRGSHEGRTDKTGRFRMTVAATGEAVLWIFPKQYAPMQLTVEHQQADLGVLTMKKGIALGGIVIDADGKPVAGQWVCAQTLPDPARRGPRQRLADMGTMLDRYARSDAAGKVTFDPLPPGDYLVGPSEGDRWRPGGGNPATPIQGLYYTLRVKIEADGAKPFELKALHTVKVVAQVYGSDGKKIAGGDGKKAGGHEITCVGRNPGGVARAWETTGINRDGRYEFLAPLGMENAGLMFRPDEISSFRFRKSADAPLRAGRELEIGTLTGDLTDICVIRYVAPVLLVKVVDRAGQPIASVEVSARYDDASLRESLQFEMQNDGRYRSSSLLPDEKFTVTVTADGYLPKARRVSLAEGTTSQLDLVLSPR